MHSIEMAPERKSVLMSADFLLGPVEGVSEVRSQRGRGVSLADAIYRGRCSSVSSLLGLSVFGEWHPAPDGLELKEWTLNGSRASRADSRAKGESWEAGRRSKSRW